MPIYYVGSTPYSSDLYHSGVKGMHWYERLYQYLNGKLTPLGYVHYHVNPPDEAHGPVINFATEEDRAKYEAELKAKTISEIRKGNDTSGDKPSSSSSKIVSTKTKKALVGATEETKNEKKKKKKTKKSKKASEKKTTKAKTKKEEKKFRSQNYHHGIDFVEHSPFLNMPIAQLQARRIR